MTTVLVNGVMQLSWVAPTQNVDGTPLTNLAGYRVYYGTQSGTYSDSVDVNDASATQIGISAPMTPHYVAMTAIDADGNESTYSNEVVKNPI